MIFYGGPVILDTVSVCQTDFTPPVFTGVSGLVSMIGGKLRGSWPVATDDLNPNPRYRVYVKTGNATGLFSAGNFLAETDQLFFDVFGLRDGSNLVAAQTYFVGVRAFDGVQEDANSVSMSAVSLGVGATVTPSDVLAIASAVWEELKASHVAAGTMGEFLDQIKTGIDSAKGVGFDPLTDSLRQIGKYQQFVQGFEAGEGN